MGPVRVLLIDEHRMLTEALASELSREPDLSVVGCAVTGDPELAALVTQARPDVITIEFEPFGPVMPLVLGQLHSACPTARIVVLTSSQDPSQVVDAARSGAVAWVPKDCSTEHLVGVLRGVCHGHASYPPEQLGVVLQELRADVQRARADGNPP
ncbi:MAG: response regulator [Pseudonocardiaceae bacterium]